jgi:hypothetical protein
VTPTNANDAGGWLWRIVQDALSHIVVQVGAVMIRFHSIPRGVMGISVKRVQMCADSVDRCKVLVGKYLSVSKRNYQGNSPVL